MPRAETGARRLWKALSCSTATAAVVAIADSVAQPPAAAGVPGLRRAEQQVERASA